MLMWQKTKKDEGSLLSSILLSFFVTFLILSSILQLLNIERNLKNSEETIQSELKFTEIQLYFETLVSRSRGIWIKDGILLFEYPYSTSNPEGDIDPTSINPVSFELVSYEFNSKNIQINHIPKGSFPNSEVLFRDLEAFSIRLKNDEFLVLNIESRGKSYESFIRLPQKITYL